MTITLSETIVCALIGLAGALIGAVFSFWGSVHQQRKESERNREFMAHEIEKMQLAWTREDTVSDTQEWKELARVMGTFIGGNGFAGQYEAKQAIEQFRATASQQESDIARELHQAVSSENTMLASRIWEKLLAQHRGD